MSASPPLVLHVIHHLVTGGLENGLVNLIRTIPASSFRHAIACVEDYSDFRERLRDSSVEVVALHRSRIGIWALRRELYKLCRRLRPAIVHTRGLSGLDALVPARLAGVRRTLHGEHGWDASDASGTRRRLIILRRIHAPFIDRYVAVSRDLANYLTTRVGIRSERIEQIYNGVDIARFTPRRNGQRAFFPAGFVDDSAVVIGTVGRIQPIKDQATLLHAFARLRSSGTPDAARLRLAIVGDGPLLASLRDLARSLRLEDSIWFAGSRADIPDILHAFDVFVLSSLNEGISNTILEAMASGLPVVATAAGGNVELIEEGVTGELFPVGGADDLAQRLTRYVADPEVRRAHGSRARERAVAHFSLEAMVSRYRKVYEELLP